MANARAVKPVAMEALDWLWRKPVGPCRGVGNDGHGGGGGARRGKWRSRGRRRVSPEPRVDR